MRTKAEHNVPIRFPTKARTIPGMFEALKAKAKTARERTEALQRDVKNAYDEFLAFDIDITSLSIEDQTEYAEIMGTLRRQRVQLEYRLDVSRSATPDARTTTPVPDARTTGPVHP